eukprot:NODE_350_length_8989_cov_0.477684.p9 type:complete len:104 gc:universal NODE_350_length_8989_cov_0.477684:4783-5094(+)
MIFTTNLASLPQSAPNINLVSMDTQGNSVCLVTDRGEIGCGLQPSFNYPIFTVNQMTGADVIHILLSPLYPYMCLLNSNAQMWCMGLGNAVNIYLIPPRNGQK